MRILDIEQLFKSEDTLDKVLEELKEDFEVVDYYATTLKSGVVNNPEELAEALQKISGAFCNLRTILALAETQKKNREVDKYNQIKIETENNDKKFVSASAEKQASAEVSSYRRIRNIIEGYKEASEKTMSSLQNINNNLFKERQTKD